MTKEEAEKAKEFLVFGFEAFSEEEVEIREGYSGRGMYGETTYAVVAPYPYGAPSQNYMDKFRCDRMGMRYVWY